MHHAAAPPPLPHREGGPQRLLQLLGLHVARLRGTRKVQRNVVGHALHGVISRHLAAAAAEAAAAARRASKL
jgi:hypothetical protein